MQKFLEVLKRKAFVAGSLLIILAATFVSFLLHAVGRTCQGIAVALIDAVAPLSETFHAYLANLPSKVTKVPLATEGVDPALLTPEYLAVDDYSLHTWQIDALAALARGETVRIVGVDKLIAAVKAKEDAARADARAKQEAWDKMSPVERYMHTHPAPAGFAWTVESAMEAMKAEAGRPFDFNDPAVRRTGVVAGQVGPGAVLMQKASDYVSPEPERATHGYTPDEPAKVETRVPTSDMSQQQILNEAVSFDAVRSSELVNGRFVVDAGLSAPMDAEEFVNRARSLHGIKTEATHGTFVLGTSQPSSYPDLNAALNAVNRGEATMSG